MTRTTRAGGHLAPLAEHPYRDPMLNETVRPTRPAPGALLGVFWRQRHLVWLMVWRDIIGRYRGSLLGVLWTFITPLLMLGIYTFVFTVVFQARWELDVEDTRSNFAIVLFVGLVIHGLMAEVLQRAPVVLLVHANYVKRVVFPLEVLPLVTCISALFHFCVSVLVVLLAMLLLGASWHATAFLLPITILPLLPLLLGIAWGLAALGVYLRDISQVTGLLATALLFISPVFFPVDALGRPFQIMMMFNPLTIIIEQSRQVLLMGELPNVALLGAYFIGSCLVCWLGCYGFIRARRGFADVI